MKASTANPTAIPIPMPSAASESTHAVIVAALVVAAGCGHTGYSASVTPSTSRIRAGSTTLFSPGTGTNANTPARRTSVRKNPRTIGRENSPSNKRSMAVTVKVSQHSCHVGRHLLQHPRHRQNKRAKKRHKARNRRKRRILNRGQNLHEAHRDPDYKADNQQRRADHQRGRQRVPNHLHYRFRRHT